MHTSSWHSAYQQQQRLDRRTTWGVRAIVALTVVGIGVLVWGLR